MRVTTYDMDELSRRSGVGARTIRSWMEARLLPRPRGRGRGAEYDERHLRRVRAVKALRDQGLSLSAIRVQLASLDDGALDMIHARATKASAPTAVPPPPDEPALSGALCEIVELMDGLALIVDATRGTLVRRIAADICRHYSHRR